MKMYQRNHPLPPLMYPENVHALRGKMKRAAKAAFFKAWTETCEEIRAEQRYAALKALAQQNNEEAQ